MHLSKHWLTVSTLKAVDVIQIEAFIISHHQNSTCLWKAISPLALIHSRILKALRVYADYRFTQPLIFLHFFACFHVFIFSSLPVCGLLSVSIQETKQIFLGAATLKCTIAVSPPFSFHICCSNLRNGHAKEQKLILLISQGL